MVLLLFHHTFLPTSVWRLIICPRIVCFQSGIFSLRWLRQLFTFGGLPEVDLLASSCSTECQHYYILETLLHLGALGWNTFNHPWMFQVGYMFPFLALVPLVLSKFLPEHVEGQLRQLILVAPCWMEAPWLPTVLNMLADIPSWCPIIKDLVKDVLVGQVLKDLVYMHLTLWLLGDVCYTDRVSLP